MTRPSLVRHNAIKVKGGKFPASSTIAQWQGIRIFNTLCPLFAKHVQRHSYKLLYFIAYVTTSFQQGVLSVQYSTVQTNILSAD